MNEVFRIFLLFCFVFSAGSVQAATLYMDPHETEIHPGDTIAVSVRVDTDTDECINAVDGIVNYPDSIVLVDISIGNSIFPVWVEPPTIDKVNNRITFAGGIPNGYCGRIPGDPRLTNMVLELIFQAPGLQVGVGDRDPVAKISFDDQTTVYLNDGAGTKASLRTFGSEIFVHKKPGGILVDDWNDRIDEDEQLPNDFSISLNSDTSIFGGKYFIVFNTTDKQSGIDHYEVIEESFEQTKLFNWGAVDAPWVVARSPYKLTDQSLNSTIRVKAVDKAGNEYIAIYVPEESMRATSNRIFMSILMGVSGVLILLVLSGAVWWYRRKTKSLSDFGSDTNDLEPDDFEKNI